MEASTRRRRRRTGLTLAAIVLAALIAAAGGGPSQARAPQEGNFFNLPAQFSSRQGQNGWYYLYGNSASGPSQAVWDTTVSPWGTLPWSSWNGSPRYLYIGSRPVGNWKTSSAAGAQMIQTGEGSDVSIGWKAPRAGTVYVAAMVNTGSPSPSAPPSSYPDDGVWVSIFKGGTRLTSEGHVFHGRTVANRAPMTFRTATTNVSAGDMLYLYIRRGAWQDADFSYYSISISYNANADLLPPTTAAQVAGGKLTITASDAKSGVAAKEYLVPGAAQWTTYTTPVTVSGTGMYLYRAIDNAGNLAAYKQISATGAGDDGGPGDDGDNGDNGDDGEDGDDGDGGGGCAKTKVTFWRAEALADCFRSVGGKWVSSGTVKLNGLRLDPQGGATITIDPAAMKVTTSGAVKIKLGDVTLYQGPLNWTVNVPNFELSVAGAAEVKGFPLTGSASFALTEEGVTIEAEVELPTIPGLPGGLTAGITLKGTNAKGLLLDKLSVDLGELPIKGLVLKGAHLGYERTDAGLDRWSASLTVSLPIGTGPVDVTGGISLLNPPLKIESVSAEADNINKVVYGPVFLQKIGVKITFYPGIKVAGTIGLTAGPEVLDEAAVSIDGTLEIALPEGGNPVTVTATGTLGVVVLELASGEIVWKVPGDVTFKGNIGFRMGIFGLDAGASGWINTSSFVAEGTGTAYVRALGQNLSLDANAVLSNLGMGACGSYNTFLGRLSVGFGWRWGDTTPSVKASGCGTGEFKPSPSAFRLPLGGFPATAGQVTVPAGQSQVLIGAIGTTGPPAVTLVSPSGLRLEVAKGGVGTAGSMPYLILQEPETKGTYFVIGKPEAGAWTVGLDAGSRSPLAQVGSANALPDPKVTATVRKVKGRYVLAWKLRAVAGQVVRFREITARSVRELAQTTKASGAVSFAPLDDGSRAKRRIEALVEQNGIPRAKLTVATFQGPAPKAPPRPAAITFRRRGTTVVAAWKRVPRAVRYELLLTVTDGRRELRSLGPKQTSLPIRRVSVRERVTVKLTAIGANGLRSPARIVTLRPKPVKKPPAKPTKK